MQRYTNSVIDTSGNAQVGKTINIYQPGTTTLVTIYSDNGITTISQPRTTDSDGSFSFYAANGTYDIVVEHGLSDELTYHSVVFFDPFDDHSSDAATSIRALSVTAELTVPVVAPGSPIAGDLWEASNLLTHGSASKVLVETNTAQTLSNKTFSDAIVSTVSTGTAPFTVASTTVVANLRAATASALATGASVTLAQLPFGTANQILGTNSGATAIEQKTLSTGTSGTDFAIAHSAGAVAFNIPDAGASARGLVTNGTQTLAGAKTFSGNVTVTGTTTHTGGIVATGRSRYSTIPIGSVAYASLGTSTTPVAGTIYWAEIFIPVNITLTGVAVLNAATVGTNKWIVALYNSAGTLVANSSLSGVLTSGPNAFQSVPFTGTYAAVGPARYWIGVQLDGTTDRFRTIAVSTYIDSLTKSATGSFGTLTTLTPPTTITADVGPIAFVYA